MNHQRFHLPCHFAGFAVFGLLLAFLGQPVLADPTDIANGPLFASSASNVKPNLMFILDDSGSMKSDYLPDNANFSATKYGKKTSQCNGVAYNPTITYALPMDSAGVPVSAPSTSLLTTNPNTQLANQFSLSSPSALTLPATVGATLTVTIGGLSRNNGGLYAVGDTVTLFSSASTSSYIVGEVSSWSVTNNRSNNTGTLKVTVTSSVGSSNLTSGLKVGDNEPASTFFYFAYTGSETPMSYTYTGSNVNTTTNFYKQCNSTIDQSPGQAVFTKVPVTSASAEAQNYVNWYTYYRSRILMAKTSISRVFAPLDSKYRVGYSTISEDSVAEDSNFLNIRDFNATQKDKFYTALNAATPSSYTPLRGALAKAGQYYANKASGQTLDPVQYSCQKNFTILSTDGYWNNNDENSTYGPFGLDGRNVGQQDGTNAYPTARPKYDGGAASVTNTTRWTTMRTLVERTTTTTASADSIENKKLEVDGCIGSGSPRRYACVIKVETKNNHHLSDGDTVTISGASPAAYNGTFTIEVTADKKFKYTVSNLTEAITRDANPDGVTGTACSAALPKTRTVATTTTGTTTNNVRVQIVVNGATTSDVTTPSSSSSDTTVTTQECVSSATPTGVVSETVSDTGVDEVAGSRSTTTTTTTVGGSSNSLADVAAYYYNNDLRDQNAWDNCTGALGSGTSVCGTADKFFKQNMITFTIGLGVNGTLKFDKNYTAQKNPGSGDFYDLKVGNKTWPVPADGKAPENIDDLWHAAVNSTDFGTVALPVANPNTQYFSANDPSQLVDSLNNALITIQQIVGSASAAATSTLQPVPGDNDLFVAKFTSAKWYGDVQRFSIDPTTGAMSAAASWSASAVLDARDLGSNPRKVYFRTSGALEDFTYTQLSAAGLNGYFDNFCGKSGVGGNSAPLQCGLILDKTEANKGSNLVAYLLGAANDNYRARDSRLGDIINGAPLFVGTPKFKYTEHDYAAWAAVTRQGECTGSTAGDRKYQGTVYVGANDGMLHAFDRCDGSEKWAYVPSMVIPNLYKLADTGYPTNHQFYVDGAPVMGDIYVDGAWKTILVGGLNAGGRGYYALDVTDPASPKALWEFTNSDNANLGLTFGNPVITKRADGTWVVAFASGYNNVNGGDGNGHLIVINANTGAALADIPTLASNIAVGSTATPSGLAKINAWIDSETDNTAKRFYGGDMLGNIWRFDLDSLTRPYGKAFQLAQLAAGGVAQPVTIMPELAEVNYLGAKYAVVYVGTGRYLGMSDLSTTGQQSIYAFKDALSETGLGDLRAGNTLVAQTLTTSTTNSSLRTATKTAVDWSTKNGWSVDLPTSGERVNVGMVLAFNVLSVASTVPSATACEIGGTSWLYKLDIASGSAVANAPENAAGLMLEEGKLIVGQTVVQLVDGSATTLSTLSDGNLRSDSQPPPPSNAVLRRTSWRELAN